MEDQTALLAELNASWFASGLEPETAMRLAGLARSYSAEPGQELFREGDPSELFGVVIRGRIALRTLVPERGPITILTIEPGDVFGWSTVVPPYRSTSSATAIEPLEAIVFDAAGIRAAMRSDCQLALALYPRIMVAVSRRLNATRLQLLDLFAAEQVKTW
ncbi:MAG: putative transcriptional regulator, Crp/Fnr family [Chloroflexi bacterium]|jgi:CRP-like cAMP-binding protein|nr:putative transcriptional regulator, Crp/Fnr family [Chloroflexota bacterium]